jgi:acetyl esterase/lipase
MRCLLNVYEIFDNIVVHCPSRLERSRPLNVRVVREIEYASVPGFRPLLLDLHLPPSGPDRPVILFIHGGAWMFGSRRHGGPAFEDGFFDRLVEAGFAVASVDYRLSGEAIFPAQLNDVKAAVRWLRRHAPEHGLDGTRIVAWGDSAGAHLAALLGLTGDDADLEGTEESSEVTAVIDWYGPADLTTMQAQRPPGASLDHETPESPEGRLIGGRVSALPDAARAASPIGYVRPGAPPFQIKHGADDTTVPCAQSEQLAAALRAAGVSVDTEWIEGAGHVWAGVTDLRAIFDDSVEFAKKVTRRDG